MGVSLVIPGRNCSRTIRQCLAAVVPMLDSGELSEIVFVDDGSTDDTRAIVEGYPIRVIVGHGRGPAAARNLGWRAAQEPLIWCIDSDCVAEPNALSLLLAEMADERVGGAGGSYGNAVPGSLLACLIHEEIVARHATMPRRVNYLATFNVIYRRSVLEQIGGLNESFVTAEDCDLGWRVIAAGYELAFQPESRVRHYHPMQWRPYLRTQRKHGYYRALLYMNHPKYAGGDAYSGFVDHVQPPLAMLIIAMLPTLFFRPLWWVVPLLVMLLAAAQLPMTIRLIQRTGEVRYLAFAPMSMIRSYARGFGLAMGTLAGIIKRDRKGESPLPPETPLCTPG